MRPIILLFLFSAGCTPIVTAPADLLEQARRGITLVGAAADAHQRTAEELGHLRRLRLDEAFDADVRNQPSLSPAWVIEHRQAYAAGLSALHEAAEQSRQDTEAMRANLAATDAALVRARWLMDLQLRWGQLVPIQHD